MKKAKILLSGIILVIISVTSTLIVQELFFRPRLNLKWHYSECDEFKLTLSLKAFTGKFPLPEISIQNHKWKIIHPTEYSKISVGWMVEAIIEKIPLDKIPTEHRKREKIDDYITKEPSTNLPYELEITVTFYDKDGFEIISAKKTTMIISGESEEIQGEFKISFEKAIRLDHSSIGVHVIGCPWD